MTILKQAIDFVLHLNTHLDLLIQRYGVWVYLILFLIIFCETGLVVTPFLPGDSLLFAVGTFCALGSLNVFYILALLWFAAVAGDTLNYTIGYWTGPKVFSRENSRLLNRKHLDRTHAFYQKYGGKAIVIARFMPIFRTFAPFVAGIGRMTFTRFIAYSIGGGFLWIFLFVLGGYFFGGFPFVKKNFSIVILAIIIISVLPAVIEVLRHRRKKAISTPAGV